MRILAAIGGIAIVIVIAAGVYLFGGFYNVSAAVDDLGILNWALVRVRESSMDRRANATPPIKLDDPATIRKGARGFAEHGCANCHGAPGVNWAKFSEGLNPGPADLKEVADDEPGHVFWAVKNGIKMTGMPSFGKVGVPDDSIWEIVAFIKKMSSISEADYKVWTAPSPETALPTVTPPPPAVETPPRVQDTPPPALNTTPPAQQ
jgi:mono/diheme cytochrome c family protein